MSISKQEEKAQTAIKTVLYSPVLYHGFINVAETKSPSNSAWLSGTRLKSIVFPLLHRMIRHTPVQLALIIPRILVGMIYPLYFWPGNPLRKACSAVCVLARTAGRSISPWDVYKDFLNNALGTIENFFILYRHGAPRVLPRIRMAQKDIELVQGLIRTHGGIVLAVPHNLGSAFSALLIGHTFDMLLVAKNSPTIERTRIAIDFYERMKLSLLMVRGGNTFELSRVLFKVLKQRKLVAATLDNIDRTENRACVTFFGEQVGLSVWAAKIAGKMQVPVVPAYFSSKGKYVDIKVGEPLISDDIQHAVGHYAAFFESEILQDPASWAYLADKHWQKVLARAVDAHS